MQLGVALIVVGSLGSHLQAQDRGDIVCWGTNHSNSCITRTGPFLHVDHGYKHVVGLRADGTLLLEGNNDRGQLDIPAGTYRWVSAGYEMTIAIDSNGQAHHAGSVGFGANNVPSEPLV